MPPRGRPCRRVIDLGEQTPYMCGRMPLPLPPPPPPLPPPPPPPPPCDRGYPNATNSLAECARHLAEAMVRILQPV